MCDITKLKTEAEQQNIVKVLFEVSGLMTSTLELQPLLEAFLDRLQNIVRYHAAAVFELEGESLNTLAYKGSRGPALLLRDPTIKRFPVHAPSLESIFGGAGKVRILSAISNDIPEIKAFKEWAAQFPADSVADLQAWIGAPLIIKDRLIGMLALQTSGETPGDLAGGREELIRIFAGQMAVVIENARLDKEEWERRLEAERRGRINEGLRSILAVDNATYTMDQVLSNIIHLAGDLFGTDTVALYRLEPEEGMFVIKYSQGLPAEYASRMTVPVGEGAIGRAVRERALINVSDITELFPRFFSENPERYAHLTWLSVHFKGLLAIPLLGDDGHGINAHGVDVHAGDTHCGGIVLYYPTCHHFTKEDLDLAKTFADQAVLALENAHLRARAEENAAAAERNRLARDLHDAVTQTLFAASLIAEVLPKIWEKNPDEVWKRLLELKQLTKGALAEMRTLLLELRPAAIGESGLKELLKQLTEAAAGRSRIPIALMVEGQPLLPVDVKIAFYRISQEALNNIVKHSGATNVNVELLSTPGESGNSQKVRLNINDNGYGFDIALVTGEHLGLHIMQERAEAIGAALIVESRPGQGTEVSVEWTEKE